MEMADEGAECTCQRCGALLAIVLGTGEEGAEEADGPRWEASLLPEAAVPLLGEDPLLGLIDEAERQPTAARAEELTGVRAQLLALTHAGALRLWLPAAAVVALGLVLGVGLLVVGQRVERALALVFAPLAIGLVAWSMVLAASAVARLMHLRVEGGQAVGMGRSLRMILEHGNGALGSAFRFVAMGVAGSTLCGLVALFGAFPGLEGPGGLAVTGALFLLQVLAVGASIGVLGLMVLGLLVHPGLAAASAVPPGRVFRFVLGLLLRESRDIIRRAVLPLGTAVAALLVGWWLLRVALLTVVTLNERILGPGYMDLIGASPVRVLFGAPELLDPSLALSAGGLAMALSLTLAAAVVLGYVASFLGISGYLFARGLGLPARLTAIR